ncbi:MAG: cell division protein ZapA [Candidatus Lindowbacteria bacterium]|nr:cell division protein ZapA [Candidatus Lindowbacteria bacterium]
MNRPMTVKVSIYGTEFTFKTDDPEYITELAEFVDEQVRKISLPKKVSSPTKAITLAAFNIADELFRLRKELGENSKKLSERVDSMLKMAEEAHQPPREKETRQP